MRHDLTPPGPHYVLVHHDVPAADPDHRRLTVGGRVPRPLDLGPDALRTRPAVTRRVTPECAGNDRARLSPRDPAHPWAWTAWRTTWTVIPGLRHLTVRATDATGRVQPLTAPWNRGGFADNLVQRVEVLCAPEQEQEQEQEQKQEPERRATGPTP
ncbi:molybdopterin-dependent oxidoreductase [Streptomyces sp. NPDC014773]|uniref:molybdopterin-dependent oxidoreductase n=1 Tax=Streptomyces sp. NPDC014773 TaxID=3364908 RepID=UPI0036FFD465